MQLTTLLTAAGLAVANSNAFLLPFSDSAADNIVTTLPVPVSAEAAPFRIAAAPGAELHNVMISCPGCGPRVRGPHMLDSSPPQLELNFSIAHAADADHLLVNGFQLYPKPALASMRSEPLKARVLHPNKKLPEHMSDRHHHDQHARRLSFSVHSRKVAHSAADNLDLVEVHLDVLQVGRSPVQLPTVELKLIKSAEGGLMIGDVALKVFKMPANIDDCTSFFCRWRMTVMQAFRRLRLSKPCHGSSPEGISQGGHQLEQPPHVHHGHRASWGQLLKNIGAHILLPVAIGIVAGVAASVLGMMVGTVIVCLWRTFFRPASRRHHRRHSSHKAAKTEVAAAADEEKSSLMAHQDLEEEIDAPPAYADDKMPESESA